MLKIILYADNLTIDKNSLEKSVRFWGDILIAGRSPELQGPKIETIRSALNIILSSLGPDGEIEVRNRTS